MAIYVFLHVFIYLHMYLFLHLFISTFIFRCACMLIEWGQSHVECSPLSTNVGIHK